MKSRYTGFALAALTTSVAAHEGLHPASTVHRALHAGSAAVFFVFCVVTVAGVVFFRLRRKVAREARQ